MNDSLIMHRMSGRDFTRPIAEQFIHSCALTQMYIRTTNSGHKEKRQLKNYEYFFFFFPLFYYCAIYIRETNDQVLYPHFENVLVHVNIANKCFATPLMRGTDSETDSRYTKHTTQHTHTETPSPRASESATESMARGRARKNKIK